MSQALNRMMYRILRMYRIGWIDGKDRLANRQGELRLGDQRNQRPRMIVAYVLLLAEQVEEKYSLSGNGLPE